MPVPGPVDVGHIMSEFPGGSFNALVADYYRRRSEPKPAATPSYAHLPCIAVTLRNNTPTTTVPPGGVVRLEEYGLPNTNDNRVYRTPVVGGATPATGEPFAILRDYLQPGAIRQSVGIISGLAWARLLVNSSAHEFADVIAGDADRLQTATSGRAELISTPHTAPNGVVWAIVFINQGATGGTVALRMARVSSTITAAAGPLTAQWGSGTVQYQDDATGEVSSEFVVVRNMWIDVTWPADSQVLVNLAHDPPRVVTGTCAPVSWSTV